MAARKTPPASKRRSRILAPIRVSPEPSPYETAVARSELARQLRKLPDVFLECRDLLHAWDGKDSYILEEVRKQQKISRTVVCLRCGTKRRDYFKIIDGGLERTTRVYTYPDGYMFPERKLPPGSKPLAVVRAESIRRALGIHVPSSAALDNDSEEPKNEQG